MSPLVTINSSPAGRIRRVRGASSGFVGDWHYPNAGGGVLGPGANAPSWSGKTIYDEERFLTPLTSSERNGGFRFYSGFDVTPPAGPRRVTYPTVATPLGEKPVLRMSNHGQTETLSALNAATTPWEFESGASNSNVYRAAVYTLGTWSGTLEFQVSDDDGDTWAAYELTASATSGGTHVTGTSTTVNGVWVTLANSGAKKLLRVVMTNYVSGSAEVRVGAIGGYSPADFLAGRFTGEPTRIYSRILKYLDASWTNGGNTGTKGTFFSQIAGKTNHFFFHVHDGIGLQVHVEQLYLPTTPPPAEFGVWLDCEAVLTGGTSGGADGTAQLWVNGVQTLNASDVRFFPASEAPRFTALYENPTYGGGNRPAPYTIYQDYAAFYRESAP